MSDEPAFLQAILENPDDDHLRLVYADWLEERGEPRAEFIRVQLALASRETSGQRKRELLVRQQQLLRFHQKTWLGPLQNLPGQVEFQRGFPEKLMWLDGQAFLEHGASFFETAPIRSVCLRNVGSCVADLVKCTLFGRLRSLELSGLNDSELGILVESPHLKSIQELNLSGNGIGLPGVRSLAASPHLSMVNALSMSHNPIGDLGLYALVSSAYLRQIGTLRVAYCDLSDASVQYLIQSPILPNLELLDLSDNQIGNAGLRELVGSPQVAKLTVLRLNRIAINSLAIPQLVQSPHLRKLTSLSLQGNCITDQAALVLAIDSNLPQLRELNLRSNQLSHSACTKLRERFGKSVSLDDAAT